LLNPRSIAAIVLGVLVTLSVYGYRFGTENHSVYLLEAIRRTQPPQLQNDWFTTQTIQYHIAFTFLSEILIRLHILQFGFLAGYLALIIFFHIATRGIIKHLAGNDAAYLLCIALYYLSAAGTGLGVYQFFQDSSFLPSNIASVALLFGIYLWLIQKQKSAAICFGIAGIFHLNFALICIPLWFVLVNKKHPPIAATILAILPCILNIAFAIPAKFSHSRAMPFQEFLDLYVRLRHPHHYDPSTWPIALWIAALWPIIPGLIVLRGTIRRVFLFFLLSIVIALIGAGVWHFNETLVQMSLYRFSIYPQLLGCAATGAWIEKSLDRNRIAQPLGTAICLAMAAICIIRGPFFGLFRIPADRPDYVTLCEWASHHTPVDAIFLVPPDEQSMRLIGRRAIIVNYKSVPQLSGELIEWRDRLCDVLAMQNLNDLPRGYPKTLAAIRDRYDALSSQELFAAAEKYHVRYIVTSHGLVDQQNHLIHASGQYMLYDLNH
jgi:hypothetical protein